MVTRPFQTRRLWHKDKDCSSVCLPSSVGCLQQIWALSGTEEDATVLPGVLRSSCPTHPFLLHIPTGQRAHAEFCLKGQYFSRQYFWESNKHFHRVVVIRRKCHFKVSHLLEFSLGDKPQGDHGPAAISSLPCRKWGSLLEMGRTNIDQGCETLACRLGMESLALLLQVTLASWFAQGEWERNGNQKKSRKKAFTLSTPPQFTFTVVPTKLHLK